MGNGTFFNGKRPKLFFGTSPVKKMYSGANIVYARAFTYTTGTLPTGVASLTCYRSSCPYSGEPTGALASGSTIYYGDIIY